MHDIVDGEQELLAQGSAGMENAELFLREMMLRQEDHCQGITQGQGSRRTRRRSQSQRAGFFFYGCVEDDVGVLGQRRIVVADDGDEFGTDTLERRQDVEDFYGFPAVRKGQYDIIGRDHAQVAVDGFSRMEENGWRPCTGQRRRYFAGNVAGFPHARDDDPALRFHNHVDGIDEILIERRNQLFNALCFLMEHVFCFF